MKYSHRQITYALNYIANSPSGHKGSVSQLETYARKVIEAIFSDTEVQGWIGEWELVWGPAVYQEKKWHSEVADNAMYVARSKANPNELVIAISGTNPNSWNGWLLQDLDVIPVENWTYANQPDSNLKIAHGTCKGLRHLQELRSHDQTLLDYLGEQVKASPTDLSVTVTGHSLGGALSPVVALMLKDLQGNETSWDPQSTASIAVMPTAGPTAGNKAWAAYYDSKLGLTTTRVWNQIDIVPHAWERQLQGSGPVSYATLGAIPTLYQSHIPSLPIIEELVQIAKDLAEAAFVEENLPPEDKNFYQICHQTNGSPSSFHPITLKELIAFIKGLLKHEHSPQEKLQSQSEQPNLEEILQKAQTELERKKFSDDLLDGTFSDVVNTARFLYQILYQHTTAYDHILGTEKFAERVKQLQGKIKIS